MEKQLESRAIIREYEARKKREQRERTKRKTEANVMETNESVKQRIVFDTIKFFNARTQSMERTVKCEIFNQISQHPAILGLRDQSFTEELQVQAALVANVRNTLAIVKQPTNREELFLKKSTLTMLMNSTEDMPIAKVARVLQVSKPSLYKARSCVQATSHDGNGLFSLAACWKHQRGSTITEELKELVYSFWESESRVSPNKKDVCRKRLGKKSYIKHPVHLLDEPQVELFRRFKAHHPECKIQLRSFEYLKPFFVRRVKDRYTCCCEYHVQMSFLKDALNHMRSQKFGLHGCGCTCSCEICAKDGTTTTCSSIGCTFNGVTQLWESVICPKQEDESFHNRKCLMGQCKNCGVKNLACCPLETRKGGHSMIVKVFAFVETMDKGGNKRKRKDLLNKEIQCWQFLELLKSKLSFFITHNYVARWQAQQFKECIQNFPNDVVVSVIDFAENYAFKEQHEIQSMHWHSTQVTILVHITYYRKAGDLMKTVHFFISDDRVHDTLFVQHCFMLHFEWLKEQGITIKSHWVWSDGAASQFKACRPFYFVARYAGLTGIQMSHFFSASGHGKGEHDGAGAVVKRTLTHEQLKPDGATLKCASDVVSYCRANLSEGAEACYSSKQRSCDRVFWEVKLGDVNREVKWNCEPIPKSRSVHAIRAHNPRDSTGLATRHLACFCDACMHGRWNRCVNQAHVPSWDYHILKPLPDFEPLLDDEDAYDEVSYEGHHDVLSNAIEIGDNFAVQPDTATNTEAVDFYLVKCIEEKDEAEDNYVDEWQNSIAKGTYVIKGLYYKQRDAYSFNLLSNMPPVHILSHLVRCIKIPMEHIPKKRNLYCITPETYEAIYNSMPFGM